jgi:hypothetical protein
LTPSWRRRPVFAGRRRALARSASARRPETTEVAVTFAWCLENGVDTRPEYLWPLLLAGRIADALQCGRIAALEFGVAGGNGLVALEKAAEVATDLLGVEVEVFGFDSGTGMPGPVDHRDVPWVIKKGYFPMDEEALRARLTNAQLVLGPVGDTVPEWSRSGHPPVGFVAFDLDYYSSTMEAFGVLEGPPDRLLPRVPCYFDDVFGYGWSDFTGERAAIADFNATHEERKIGKIHGLRYELPRSEFMQPWHEQLYLLHAFDHPEYGTSEGPLDERWFSAHRLHPDR